MKPKTVAAIVVLVLVGWFAWMGVRTLNSVDQAQRNRAAQIEQLAR